MGIIAAAALAAMKAAANKAGQNLKAHSNEQKQEAKDAFNKVESTLVNSSNTENTDTSEATNGSSVDVGPSLGESLVSGLKSVKVDSNSTPEVASTASQAAPEVAESGALTSDANCKNLKPISKIPGKEDTIGEEAEHAKKHFNTMLNNTPDADPSNGLEKHNVSESEVDAYFSDDTYDDDDDYDYGDDDNSSVEEPFERKGEGEETEKAAEDEEEEAEDEDAKAVPAYNGESLGKTVRDAVVAKHVLKTPHLSASPDVTSKSSELTRFSRDGVGGSKVLLSDENEKDIKEDKNENSTATKVKQSLKDEGLKRVRNAGQGLAGKKTQAPAVTFNNNYSSEMDYDLVSDERLKELFGDDDISCLSKIHSYDFTYKPEAQERLGDKNLGVDDLEHHGVIAQELEDNPAFKGVVTEMPDGTKALKTKELTAANTAAVGDLARAIETIAGRLDNIENMLGDRQ